MRYGDRQTTRTSYAIKDLHGPHRSHFAYIRTTNRFQVTYYGNGVALDDTGNMWVADGGNNRVLRFPVDPTTGTIADSADMVLGQIDMERAHTGDKPGEFHAPSAVAFDSNGWLYVADTGNDRVPGFRAAVKVRDAGEQSRRLGIQPPCFRCGRPVRSRRVDKRLCRYCCQPLAMGRSGLAAGDDLRPDSHASLLPRRNRGLVFERRRHRNRCCGSSIVRCGRSHARRHSGRAGYREQPQ